MRDTRVAVVGAGTMGASIALALVTADYPVVLKEMDESLLEKGFAIIDRLLASRVKKGLHPDRATEMREMISGATDYQMFADVDFVIEAASENIEVKRAIFQDLDQHCHLECILATNTSSLSISQIAGFTRRADKVVGLHFFNPAHIMKLVEVIPGLETSHDTVLAALELASSMDKLAVRVEECASFLVNRLLNRYMNESLFCLQSGLATVEEIDQAAVDYVVPIGPLALRDMNGADIGLAVATFNYNEYGPRFAVPQLLSEMVRERYLGQKTGAGFYNYEERKRAGVNPELASLVKRCGSAAESGGFSGERLFLPMINEAFMVMQERICRPEDLDSALMAGLGMRRGPLTLASEIGLARCLSEIERLFETCGERFRPAPLLKRFVWSGRDSVV